MTDDREYRTASGEILTATRLDELAAEAEAGYEVGPCNEHLGGTSFCGRPGLELAAGGEKLGFKCSQHRQGFEARRP